VSVLLQVSVEVLPLVTLNGEATNDRAGAAACCTTTTVAVAELVPPAPVHANEKLELAVSGPTVSVPLAGFEPDHAPDATHPSAFVADQVRVDVPPLAIDVGAAARDVTGTVAEVEGVEPTCTVVFADDVPPGPTHCRL
jgi:hypothetical protein